MKKARNGFIVHLRYLWFTAKIENKDEATDALKVVGKAWVAFAAINAIVYTFLFVIKSATLSFLMDTAVCVLAGFFLPRSKSRTLSVFMLLFSLGVAAPTVAARLGISGGGRNVILAIILVVISYRGLRAAFAYHRFVGTKVLWKNVFIVWGIVFGLSLVFSLGIVVALEIARVEVSDETGGAFLLVPLIIVCSLAFFLLPRKFPLVVSCKPKPLGTDKELRSITTKSEKPEVILIPKVVRIYGMMFMIGSAIILCLSIGNMLFGSSIVRSVNAISFIYALAFFLIGLGLWKGKRSGVIGMTIVGAFAGLMLVLYIAIGESLLFVAIVLAIACGIYAPPLISAYRNWEQFY